MRLYREARANPKLPWVSIIVAEGTDLEVLQREAITVAKREGGKPGMWEWSPDRLGGAWEMRLDEDNGFAIKRD